MKSNHLKAFIRYSNKKIVAGSLILAQSMPKTRTWKEVPVDECCSPTICLPEHPVEVITDSKQIAFPIINPVIIVRCGNEADVNLIVLTGFGEFATIDELLIYLNTNCSSIGTYSINGDGNIVLTTTTVLLDLLGCTTENIFFNISRNEIPIP